MKQINFFAALVEAVNNATDLSNSVKVLKTLNKLLIKHSFNELPPLNAEAWKFSKFPSNYNNKSINVTRYFICYEEINFFIGTEDMEGAFGVVLPSLSLTVSKPGNNGTVFGESSTWLYENVTEFLQKETETSAQ